MERKGQTSGLSLHSISQFIVVPQRVLNSIIRIDDRKTSKKGLSDMRAPHSALLTDVLDTPVLYYLSHCNKDV